MESTEGSLRAHDGVSLFTRRFMPAAPAKGIVCLLHGFGEHSGRYKHVGERLCAAGFALSAFDLRGHGRSDGARGDTRFLPTLHDIDASLDDARTIADGAPIFLYGHSLGGLLVLTYLLDRRPSLAGVVVSGPALHTSARRKRAKVLIARVLGGLAPSLSVSGLLDREWLMRDPVARAAYEQDPLVHNRGSAGFGRDALAAQDRVLRDAKDVRGPLLLLHGGADRVNFKSGSEHVAAQMGAACTLKIYDGLFHTIHQEPEKQAVLDDVVAFLEGHANGRPSA